MVADRPTPHQQQAVVVHDSSFAATYDASGMHRALADLAVLAVLADLVAEEAAGLRDGPVVRAAYRPLL